MTHLPSRILSSLGYPKPPILVSILAVVPLSDVLTTGFSYRPERWAAPPQEARAIPGLYSNTLTFLNGNPIGGNRACIGYKFALIE